jgi:two-component system, cell cycle response regulator
MRAPHITGAWMDHAHREGPRALLLVEPPHPDGGTLQSHLEAFGYRVLVARSVVEARAAVAQCPAVVVLDWELPDGFGPDLLTEWMEHAEMRWTPVVMVTGSGDPQRVRTALERGAVDFIRRPADPIELEARLRSALRLGRLQTQMRALAQRDGLTGLWNRHVVLERIERCAKGKEINPARCLSVAMFDIDHFKMINDNYGHDVGDVVLQQFAEQLFRDFGPYGSVARFGGEEFLVFLPGHTAEIAQRRVLTFREYVAERCFGDGKKALHVTFSAGVAACEVGHGANMARLLKRVDLALYAAKHEGRDRIVVADVASN